jgi:hypothetical protein
MGAQISHAVAVRSGSHKHQSQAQRKPRDRSRQTSLISFSLGFSFHLLPVVHACGPRPDRGRAGAPEDLLKSKIVFGFDAGPGGPVRSTRRRRAFTVLVIRICYFQFRFRRRRVFERIGRARGTGASVRALFRCTLEVRTDGREEVTLTGTVRSSAKTVRRRTRAAARAPF